MISDRDLFGGFPPKPYRCRALLDLANGQRCVRCGRRIEGAVVACHYHGPYADLFGRAGSQKSDDDMCAHLCDRCHALFDSDDLAAGGWHSKIERAFEFSILIHRTRRVLRHQGRLVTVINKKPKQMEYAP